MTDLPNNAVGGTPDRINISELLLDESNPRFGELERGVEQSQLVDLIIDKFGIEDVVSSLAMNGFFAAEPLVCVRRADGKLVVKEGNRRLCACIVLTGDARAVRQEKLTNRVQKAWTENGSPAIEPIPVLIFEQDGPAAETMLSYLGVRHIASAQPWDSYAKASWVAKITDDTGMPVSKITEMIGDQHSTVVRLLEGYRFIRQMVETGHFQPSDSQKRGRGSVSEYPFSWVYTILGYKATRDFCGLQDKVSDKPNPIPETKLGNAATVVQAMFGDRKTGRSSAIVDSRQLVDLAKALSDPDKVALLKTGSDLVTVLDKTKPIEIKLEENLSKIRSILSDLVASVSETPPEIETAKQHLGTSVKVRSSASDLAKRLKEIADKEFEEDDD
ncbi:hypothetical protein ASD8599_01091 [Ascidiaceihabitans donghaensis]|uniref:ParB/Sulfiredoxin domain-containing protein n=1 Tax=Ascidiaceihabitans donghaensis TaxID=1510460 RepID=A0A2R8BBB5_9RHOB|nr:hypothetical protein [Ascidiaceihabitans donghaensis]SPH20355.1 hypothetical protein ASD8599_01091 [Ascidiaceihabitans donghaensis]